MDGQYLVDGFDFKNQAVINQNIQAHGSFHGLALIDNGYRDLRAERNRATLQLTKQASLIDGFQQAWPDLAMNFDGGPNDLFRPSV